MMLLICVHLFGVRDAHFLVVLIAGRLIFRGFDGLRIVCRSRAAIEGAVPCSG